MNPTSSIVLTGALVALGKWSKDEKITVRIVVGIAGAAVGLAVISEANEPLASKLALLVLISAVFLYGPAVAKKAGLIK